MFISLVQSDSIYLGTCEWCQEILKTYPSFDLTTVDVEYQIYKAMQNVAYQSIYQKENYHRVILYDTNQNEFVYGDNRFSAENQKYHMALVDEFLSGNQREAYLPIHQSPWNDFRTNAFPECISYIKKVYDYDSGKLIGAIEFEIDCDTLGELYQTVLSDRNAFLLLAEDGTVISSSDEEIAVHTALNAQWLEGVGGGTALYRWKYSEKREAVFVCGTDDGEFYYCQYRAAECILEKYVFVFLDYYVHCAGRNVGGTVSVKGVNSFYHKTAEYHHGRSSRDRKRKL